ncbi:MAG: class I tRNA ligase family protein, partial [Candidatus Micrarchaeota archaeon]|nr:class I tRNA ligase family protein [Candidatus Micrarchaeota archaeon]
VVLNEENPYGSLIMHGYVVDEKGNAMHKSLGNYVPWEDVISKYPADAVRLMALSNTTWDDLRFNWNEMNEAKNELMIINNIATYIDRFYNPSNAKNQSKMIEDLWLESKTNSLIKEVTEHMEKGESFLALRKIRNFLIQDVSRFYMKLIKKREDISVLYHSFFKALILASPFIPFTAESIYQRIYSKENKEESIFFFSWPKAEEKKIDKQLEREVEIAREIAEGCNSIRASANLKLRWPLEELIVVSRSIETSNTIRNADRIIRLLTNVKSVKIDEKSKYKLSEAISERFDEKIIKEIKEVLKKDEGSFLKGAIEIEGRKIEYGDFITVDGMTDDYREKATVYGVLKLKIKIDESLRAEGIMSEIRRRIQSMRKEMNLVEKDRIEVYIKASEEIENLIKEYSSLILEEINAEEIKIGGGGKLKKTWDIEEEKVTIGITPI